MKLLGNENRCIFTLTHDDIVQAILEYVDSRYSLPVCEASAMIQVRPREQDISATITVPISILEVTSKE